jgi:hypothetical protein
MGTMEIDTSADLPNPITDADNFGFMIADRTKLASIS